MKVTQHDIDNLADIIWWVKGYMAGARDNRENCPFEHSHEESLRRAREKLLDLNEKEESHE